MKKVDLFASPKKTIPSTECQNPHTIPKYDVQFNGIGYWPVHKNVFK